MNIDFVVVFFGVICLSAVQSSPVLNEAEVETDSPVEENVPLILPHAYTVINETGSTFEAIMQDIAARKPKEIGDEIDDNHSISKRVLGSSHGLMLHNGSTNGMAFSDFLALWCRHHPDYGAIIDSLQLTYKTVQLASCEGKEGQRLQLSWRIVNISLEALGCSQTNIAYGSTNGTAFSDFTTNPWPCGVDIIQITVGHGLIIDSLQFTYKTFDQTTVIGERRGGTGGTKTTIVLEDGEHITGVSGLTCGQDVHYLILTSTGTEIHHISGIVVRQLIFFAEKQDGQKVVYGPYGWPTSFGYATACHTFAVNAKINSMFGKVGSHSNGEFEALSALGFYYEDESSGSQNSAA